MTWPEVSIPQNALPITIKGHPYLVEVDEYTSSTTNPDYTNPSTPTTPPPRSARRASSTSATRRTRSSSPTCGSRSTSPRRGPVTSRTTPARRARSRATPATTAPCRSEVDPTIVACSFIISGLRVFDIHDPLHPKEIAYFNGPIQPGVDIYHSGAFAMSAPAFVPARNEIWYTDGNSGFYVVRLTASAFAPAKPVAKPPVTKPVAQPPAGGGSLPTTGLSPLLPWLAVAAWPASASPSCACGRAGT